jgi:hypothetical protein
VRQGSRKPGWTLGVSPYADVARTMSSSDFPTPGVSATLAY